MKLYLAGPMTGIPELNFPAFHAEAARLRSLGLEVVNPAEINVDPAAGWGACMRADIKQLVDCDGIALLPGWTCSRGARLEHHIAQELGMVVVDAPGVQRDFLTSAQAHGAERPTVHSAACAAATA